MATQVPARRVSPAAVAAAAVAALLGILLLLYALLRLGALNGLVAGLIEDALSDPATGTVAVVEGLAGDPLADFAIRRLSLSERGKATLVLEDATARWRHLGLLAGNVRIERLHARRLSLASPPPGGPEEPFTGLPSLPVDLRLDRLKIDEVRFEGEDTPFTLLGTARWRAGPKIELRLALAPQDARGESIRLSADYDQPAGRLALDGRLMARGGGGLGGFLFPGEEGDIVLTLDGEGPVSNWRGRLEGTRDGERIADLTIILQDRLRIAGVFDPRPFLPKDEVTALIGAPAITVEMTLEDGLPESYDATLINPGAELRLRGRLTDNDALMSPQFSLRSRNADWFAPVLGEWRYATLGADGEVRAGAAGPSVSAAVAVTGLAGAEIAAARVDGRIEAEPEGGALAIAGEGALEGVELSGQTLRADWMLRATYHPERDRIEVERAALSDGGSSIVAQGEVTLQPLAASGSLAVALADLRRWPALGAAGRLEADATVAWRPDAGRLQVRAEGRGRGVRLEDPSLSALLGPTPSFRLVLDDPAGTGRGELDGAVDGAGVAGRIKGRIGQTIDAAFDVRFADAGDVLGDGPLRADGPLAVSGRLSGETASPDVTLRAALDEASLSGATLADVALAMTARDVVDAPSGRAELRLSVEGEPVAVDLPFAVAADGTWTAAPIRVTGKPLALEGELVGDALGAPMRGELRLRLSGKPLLTALAGMPAAGSLDGTVTLFPVAEAQGIRADLTATRLAVSPPDQPDLAVARARLRAELTLDEALDVGRIALEAKDARWARAELASLTATVTPSGDGLALDARASGEFDGPLSIALRGRAERAVLAAPNRIVIEAFDGTVTGQKIDLTAPAVIVLAERGTEIGPVRMRYNGAPVTARASIRDDGASTASVSAEGIDLAALSALTEGQKVTGRLDLDAEVSMDAVPNGRFSVRIADLLVEDTLDQQPLSLRADGTLGGGALAATLRIETGGQRALDATARLPVRRGEGAFALEIDDARPLDVALKGTAELAHVWPLTGAYQHLLGGRATVDARVSGSMTRPNLNGTFAVTDFSYRNLFTGTRIGAPQVRFTLRENLLELPPTAANDGNNGSITLSGWIKPLAPDGLEADLSARFVKARVLKRRDVTAKASGEIRFQQDAESALISGEARVDEVEYTLVSQPADDVIKLYVVELNRPPGLIELPEKPEPQDFPTRLRIDVTADNQVFVRGRGLDSEWRGQVRVRGTVADPALQGRIELVRGRFDFAGRKFELQDGSRIELVGGGDLDPVITARAVYSVPSLTAEIALTGRASNPQIKLSSQPEMPQDEIISRVLFGTGRDSLSAFEAAQLAAAVASLGSSGSGLDVIGKLRGAFSLDRLTVGTLDRPGEDDEEGGAPVIRGGKYITKNIYLEFGSATEEEDAASASVDIDLTRNLSVGTEATSTGNQKFRVRYKLDY
jgi:translocation and assembly module TamB